MSFHNFLPLLTLIYLFTPSFAQSTLPICRNECSKLRGQCNISLFDLSRTPCFDDRTNTERTCDCGINSLQQLANFPPGTTIRDCVIHSLLFNTGSAVTIDAKLENVHTKGYLNVGQLVQRGDIHKSTFCRFQCTGRNRFENCIVSGSVTSSHLNILNGLSQATLSISGPKFRDNIVNFIRSDKDIQIGCADGFDNNTVEIFGTRKSGQFSTVAGTSISDNRFNAMTVGSIRSFATVDGNTAGIATAVGPCLVSGVKEQICVDELLAIPDGDAECAELFRKV